jgi:chaperonin GroES
LAFPLKVFGARTVIKLDKAENKTLGGIIIASAENEEVNKGEVVAVGDGQRLDNGTHYPMTVNVGDRVIFNPMSGAPAEVTGDDNKYIILNESHILAVIEAE